MKYIIAILTCLAIFVSCRQYNSNNTIIGNPESYEGKQYTIQVDRDTTLKTENGAYLKIPKGALSVENGNTATLEIKEAYSIEQMIKAGLTTSSNGELLSSGGMIYINAVGGQNVKITQAIKVALPANYLDKNMQLFKGETKENDEINWKDPQPLPENKQLETQEKGKVLFQSRCSSCHIIGKEATGPDLAHMMKRFDINVENNGAYFLHSFDFYRNFYYEDESLKEHLENINIYKCNLQKQFGSSGTGFYPQLDTSRFEHTEELNLLEIYRYIQNESDRLNLPFPSQTKLKDCADSCASYNQAKRMLLEIKSMSESQRSKLIQENGPMVKRIDSVDNPTPSNPSENIVQWNPPFEDVVSPKNYESVYYQFTIETFGWYNIDVLIKGKDGVEASELFVRITGQYKEKIQVYLILPSVQIMVQGGPAARNEDDFAFKLRDGKIDLPQNTKAYILAVTETEESIAFALKEFTTSRQQDFEISLKSASKKEFRKTIGALQLKDFKASAAASKNAKSIRKIDIDIQKADEQLKSIENLKPKGCDCDCPTLPNTITIPEIDSIKK